MPKPKPETDWGMTSAAYAAGVAPMHAFAAAYSIIAAMNISCRPA